MVKSIRQSAQSNALSNIFLGASKWHDPGYGFISRVRMALLKTFVRWFGIPSGYCVFRAWRHIVYPALSGIYFAHKSDVLYVYI